MIVFIAAVIYVIELAGKIKNFLASGSEDIVFTVSDFGISFFCAAALIIGGITGVFSRRITAVAVTEYLMWGFTLVCLIVRTIRCRRIKK